MDSLSHLPVEKQKEILKALEIIKQEAKPEKVILFGSHATGKWVDSSYVEDGITISYISDYDILVVLSDDKKGQEGQIISHIENRCDDFDGIVNVIANPISHINTGLLYGQFFFMRIINEGIVLFDKGTTEFASPKILTAEEAKQKAQDYFDIWFPNGSEFLIDANNAFQRGSYRNCAFYLHQAAENFYSTVLLVFDGYKPSMHSLQKMRIYSKHIDRGLYELFMVPSDDQYQYHLFDLLKRGYIEARYKPNYDVTELECKDLLDKLERMQKIVESLCIAKIESI